MPPLVSKTKTFSGSEKACKVNIVLVPSVSIVVWVQLDF